MGTIEELARRVMDFNQARDWQQYHSPKNLAIGLSVECAELLEIFTWLTEEQSSSLNEKQLAAVKQEIGDILIYLVNLAGKFDLDPVACAEEKLQLNEKKYPVDRVKGSARKYNEY